MPQKHKLVRVIRFIGLLWKDIPCRWILLRKTGGDKVIYLEHPDYVDSLPPFVNGYRIIPITYANQYKLYKEHGKKLTHTKMSPVNVEGNLLTVSFIPFSGSLKGRRRYFLANGGGTIIYFKLDDNGKHFEYFKLEIGGI